MNIAALIVTTGLPDVSGVAALMTKMGTITTGQRMISTFQRVGVTLTGLVVGQEDKKAERQLAQTGVVFLRCSEKKVSYFQGIQQGLRFMLDKFDRVFVVPGDMSLFLPSTLEALLRSNASIAVPENKYVSGYPVLLDRQAMELLLGEKTLKGAERALRKSSLQIETVRVSDSGILIRGNDMTYRVQLLHDHNTQLTRPVVEATLCNGGPLYDPRLSMLLHLVEDTHSVRDACSLMQISYSAAWNMLNHVEEKLGFPLVTRIRGGSAGSGSVLTEKGRILMNAYDRFAQQLNQTAQELYDSYFSEVI